MWTKSQSSQAGSPEKLERARRRPRRLPRPMVASEPLVAVVEGEATARRPATAGRCGPRVGRPGSPPARRRAPACRRAGGPRRGRRSRRSPGGRARSGRARPARARPDRAARRATCASGDAATPARPQHRPRGDPLGSRRARRRRRCGHPRAGPHLDAEPLELTPGRRRERLGRRWQHAAAPPRAGSRARCSGSMWRKSAARVWRAISASAPASSTPVGPPPTIDEGEQRRRRAAIGLALGALEGEQHAPADLERVLDRLQARRERRPLVVPEVGVRGAGGDDEVVVGELAVGEAHASRRHVDAGHLRRAAPARCAVAEHARGWAPRCRPGSSAAVATW